MKGACIALKRFLRRCGCRVLLACLCGGVCLSLSSAKVFAEAAPLEHEVKAAMLYKFLGYVEWPPETFETAQEPYKIGVIGSRALENELRRITEDRTVNNRPIEIFKIRDVDRIDKPHMIFVGQKSERTLPSLTRLAEKDCFLLVTENDDGIKNGSTINLRVINDRIGFDISLANANKCSFKFSARLLSVAASVKQDDS